ncbi:hypothetical protein [Halorubrum sp. DTA46]|uniref:hypothetical protein n=1 Tax=Halorubrum sp. DTA46 TaxID=3402162 RepID=UPI003AB03464
MSRRGPPGRETAAAESGDRRTWYGWGQLTRVEKRGVGLFLHDVTRVFSELSIVSLPVLLAVMEYPTTGWFDAKATALVAWTTAVVVATLIRIGAVHPVGTATPGWVTLSPWLVALRVPYFNASLALAIFGGLAVHEATTALGGEFAGLVVGLGWAGTVAAGSVLAFPRVAEEWLSVVR